MNQNHTDISDLSNEITTPRWDYPPQTTNPTISHPPPPTRLQHPHRTHKAHGLGPLRRELKRLDIFMIGISAVIGIGFYVKTGLVLHTGGPAALVYSFVFVGILTLMVMYSISNMLRIWPIAGSIFVFVEKFVDKEVGKSVAILYWLTWSFVFAGLTTTIGSLFNASLEKENTALSLFVTIVSLVLPVILNLLSIRIFRWVEIIFGVLKLSLALCIIIIMNAINTGIWKHSRRSIQVKNVMFTHEETPAGWFGAFAVSLLLVSFCFVGIEAVATTSQEACFHNTPKAVEHGGESNTHADEDGHELTGMTRPPLTTQSFQDQDEAKYNNPFQYAMWIPLIATTIYVWGGWMVSQNVVSYSSLPTLSRISAVDSVFVKSAKDYNPESQSMPNTLTGLLILNGILTSSTALYVASRSLFGFAYATAKFHESGNATQTWWLSMMRALSQKTKTDVPYATVLASAWLFWLPFVKYASEEAFSDAINIITEMASVSCLMVWGFESLAAYRFYKCYSVHGPNNINGVPARIKSIVRITPGYLNHLRLAITGLSTFFCSFLVMIGGAMTFLHSGGRNHGIAAFAVVLVFFLLTCGFKWTSKNDRGWSWLKVGTDLKTPGEATHIFRSLEEHMRYNKEQ